MPNLIRADQATTVAGAQNLYAGLVHTESHHAQLSLPGSVQALTATDSGTADYAAGCPSSRVGAIHDAATTLACVFDPTVIATGVRLQLRPNAAELALHHAACIRTTGGVASETNTVEEQTPTSGAE